MLKNLLERYNELQAMILVCEKYRDKTARMRTIVNEIYEMMGDFDKLHVGNLYIEKITKTFGGFSCKEHKYEQLTVRNLIKKPKPEDKMLARIMGDNAGKPLSEVRDEFLKSYQRRKNIKNGSKLRAWQRFKKKLLIVGDMVVLDE